MGITTNAKQDDAEIRAMIEEFIRKKGVTRPQEKTRKNAKKAA